MTQHEIHGVHVTRSGSVLSHAIVSVIPPAMFEQADVTALCIAASRVPEAPFRQVVVPWKVMQTSQVTRAMRVLR